MVDGLWCLMSQTQVTNEFSTRSDQLQVHECCKEKQNTAKPVFKVHSREPEYVPFISRYPLYIG